jgi:hypothetical protein
MSTGTHTLRSFPIKLADFDTDRVIVSFHLFRALRDTSYCKSITLQLRAFHTEIEKLIVLANDHPQPAPLGLTSTTGDNGDGTMMYGGVEMLTLTNGKAKFMFIREKLKVDVHYAKALLSGFRSMASVMNEEAFKEPSPIPVEEGGERVHEIEIMDTFKSPDGLNKSIVDPVTKAILRDSDGKWTANGMEWMDRMAHRI